jgi:diadenylate cyclase
MNWHGLWLESPFAAATWTDGIDIAILAWLVYRALLLIRGTRAMQSLLGVALLSMIYVASDFLGLATLHYVLDTVFVYVVLAMLILFQEDIRRALARAGGTLFARRTDFADANTLEAMIRAVFELARRQIGALIVVERDASLLPYTEGTHEVGASVSTELLQSIFHPSSPLHDGAVVVANGKIRSAGVFFPITLSKELSREFGTRHRAAIGLTEATDALALVVSEERGTVSVVEGGQLTPVTDAHDLRQTLQERLGSSAKARIAEVSTDA